MPNVDWNDYLSTRRRPSYTNRDLILPNIRNRILEVGCGYGDFCGSLDVAQNGIVCGIDPSSVAIGEAKAKYPACDFRLGTAESIPFPSSYFDTVIAIEVFEHLEEPRVFLDESFRVLENNGVLIIQTPNYPVKRAYDFVYWLLGRKGDPKDDPTHVSPQSFASLAEAVGRSGFEILSLSGRNVFGENRLKFLKEMKFGRLAPYISQKAIIIARKK